MIRPSANFIAIGRNPNIEPAQWPFRRLGVPLARIEADRPIQGTLNQREAREPDKLQMKSALSHIGEQSND